MAFMAKSILADREYAASLLRHVLYWYWRRTLRGLAAIVKKKDRPLSLVASEAIGAWRGPISLYRSYHHARSAQHERITPTSVAAGESVVTD